MIQIIFLITINLLLTRLVTHDKHSRGIQSLSPRCDERKEGRRKEPKPRIQPVCLFGVGGMRVGFWLVGFGHFFFFWKKQQA